MLALAAPLSMERFAANADSPPPLEPPHVEPAKMEPQPSAESPSFHRRKAKACGNTDSNRSDRCDASGAAIAFSDVTRLIPKPPLWPPDYLSR
jgi:hypothetical protein